MHPDPHDHTPEDGVFVAPEVVEYVNRRNCDFRICTSCGGPILLSTRIKPPKRSDLLLKAGNQTIYVSIHQARFLHSITMEMIPFFDEEELTGHSF